MGGWKCGWVDGRIGRPDEWEGVGLTTTGYRGCMLSQDASGYHYRYVQ